MKICGVIAEYNPFHNGHMYQLAEARRLSGCDFLIVVMGGAFSQRGEPILLDKWTRTRMALQHGADLVVELPALFAVRSADWFARGGVETLAALGADSICFGCETDNLPLLNRTLDLMTVEDDALKEAIRVRLAEGQAHVRARGEALAERLNIPADFVSRPNTALALEYMRANRALTRPMDVHIVLRTGSYHDETLTAMASASAIRAAVSRGDIAAARASMPASAYEMLNRASPGALSDINRLDALLIDRLRMLSLEGISSLPDVSEGLEHRVFQCAQQAGSRNALLSLLKCKRYTHARLSRLLAHALLGMTSEMCLRHPSPEYARVLGFRKDAAALLTRLKDTPLPLISRASLLRENEIFALERRATDLQSLAFGEETLRAAGRDLTEKIVIE